MKTLTITPLHEERCRQINDVVQFDIVKRSLTFEQSVESLSRFLGLDKETILLSIGIVNDLDSDNPHTQVELQRPLPVPMHIDRHEMNKRFVNRKRKR